MHLCKFHGSPDGFEGIALAAAGSAVGGDGGQSRRGHLVGELPFFVLERRGAGHDTHKDTGAHGRAAAAPETADASGQLLAAALHLSQSLVQVDFAAAVVIGGQQRGPDQHVVLGPVHVDAGFLHERLHDLDRSAQRRAAAYLYDELHALVLMAVVANVVSRGTGNVVCEFFMADGALELPRLAEIDQLSAA